MKNTSFLANEQRVDSMNNLLLFVITCYRTIFCVGAIDYFFFVFRHLSLLFLYWTDEIQMEEMGTKLFFFFQASDLLNF